MMEANALEWVQTSERRARGPESVSNKFFSVGRLGKSAGRTSHLAFSGLIWSARQIASGVSVAAAGSWLGALVPAGAARWLCSGRRASGRGAGAVNRSPLSPPLGSGRGGACHMDPTRLVLSSFIPLSATAHRYCAYSHVYVSIYTRIKIKKHPRRSALCARCASLST